MKNNTTELVFLLDRSGSMQGLEADTIGGFNAMLKKQKKQEGACYVTTVLFDHQAEFLHDRITLWEVAPMTGTDYTVRGSTALLDAIGETICHIKKIHRYVKPEDVPEHTVFVITTDGMENSSHKYHAEQIRLLIEEQKENGWEFIFLGANIDAIKTAAGFGIASDRAVDYLADSMGTECLYETVAEAVCSVREGAGLSDDWNKKLTEDYKKRKRS